MMPIVKISRYLYKTIMLLFKIQDNHTLVKTQK